MLLERKGKNKTELCLSCNQTFVFFAYSRAISSILTPEMTTYKADAQDTFDTTS